MAKAITPAIHVMNCSLVVSDRQVGLSAFEVIG